MAVKINVKGPIVSNDCAWLYNYFGMDAASPNTISKGLEQADGDDVVIEINSPGGVCVYGYEMYTAIMEYTGRVTVHVISAMSAATLIACAADEALISDTGIFMIHNTRSRANGDYRDMRMEADALQEFNKGIINAYVRKTGKSREEIQALMDKNSYMSPQTAIEQGFIDGYMFGDPNIQEGAQEVMPTDIVAAEIPIIPEDKAKTVMELIMNTQKNNHNINLADNSDEIKKGGKNYMTLSEFLAENPEAVTEINAVKAEAREEGKNQERSRLQSLDAISGTVTAEALHDAKYGENPVDGPTLAYKSLVDGNRLASAYMKNAMNDFNESGVGKVGTGNLDAGQGQTDESDELAGYVNRTKGGV